MEDTPKRRGRPPKYRPPVMEVEPEEEPEISSASVQELLAEEPPKARVTTDEIAQLSEAFRMVASGDDDYSKERRKQIQAIFRGLRHSDIHPGEPEVEIDVPFSLFSDNHGRPIPFRISGIAYQGRCRVPLCVNQQLAWMMDMSQRVDAQRMRDKRLTYDLGDTALANRSRLIQQA